VQISLDTVRAIARLLDENDLAEISLQTSGEAEASPEGFCLKVQRAAKTPAAVRGSAPVAPAAGKPAPSSAAEAPVEETVSSDVVGLFRPTEPPLDVDSEVRAGQVVGIVEALKVPNEIKASRAGRIKTVLVQAGQIVEYGQPLFVLEPFAK
jgi:acetyl-CoA carboxylase biotin carboxyl carrier protein